jgi:hypothetical protein
MEVMIPCYINNLLNKLLNENPDYITSLKTIPIARGTIVVLKNNDTYTVHLYVEYNCYYKEVYDSLNYFIRVLKIRHCDRLK